ncbi:H-NS family nucleoid-associated regulatory protein [Paraburkholderia pallida]|uniref:H-NS histone family protein n=1 Tax=Paraburkholderia pallida TaxID=2547399 RepID=A0A4P7D6A1_9BURK|nr:H-NS family nucleoid-associated regulatory protein [Paraburkholderia pallida]QBR04296.1 H-NS histone family protein [Paraburkholderia pallida]
MDERKRESMVAYLRRRMAEFGIKPDDLAESIARDQRRHSKTRYRNAAGETWDGKGEIPQWLQQAMSAGQSREHFAINGTAREVPGKHCGIDWRNDPFAGTRLARNVRSLASAG